MTTLGLILLFCLLASFLTVYTRSKNRLNVWKLSEGLGENVKLFAHDLEEAINNTDSIYINSRFESISLYEYFEGLYLHEHGKVKFKTTKREQNTSLIIYSLRMPAEKKSKKLVFRVVNEYGIWRIIDFYTK